MGRAFGGLADLRSIPGSLPQGAPFDLPVIRFITAHSATVADSLQSGGGRDRNQGQTRAILQGKPWAEGDKTLQVPVPDHEARNS
jgi:hypothetical protein